MGREYELKFRATPQVLADIYAAYPGQWQIVSMETTYYDTLAGGLSARKYTLRKRMENGHSVCTLKTPEKDGSRGEWETSCDSIENAIPILCKLGAPAELETLAKEGVAAICGAKFTRRALCFTWQDSVLELALDAGILTGGNREIPLCEVEVELKSGSMQAADCFAAQLAETYDLRVESHSKFRRALDLSKGG